MSESDAAYYQAHKDDPDEWEDLPAPARRSRNRRLATMVSVRFSPAEHDLLRYAAERHRETLSAFVRGAALRAAYQPIPSASVTGVPPAGHWIQGAATQAAAPWPSVAGPLRAHAVTATAR